MKVSITSFAGFIEGPKVLHGNRFTYFNSTTSSNATTFTPLFTVLNPYFYKGRVNQSVINIINASGAVKHTNPVVYYLVKNATLLGNVNFQKLANNSCSLYDTAATQCTFDIGNLKWTGHLGETGEIDHHFGNGTFNAEETTIQPGDTYTLCVKSLAGSPAYCTGAINTREDQ